RLAVGLGSAPESAETAQARLGDTPAGRCARHAGSADRRKDRTVAAIVLQRRPDTLSYLVYSAEPRLITTAMMAAAIPDAISAYSMAVVPRSQPMKLRTRCNTWSLFMTIPIP